MFFVINDIPGSLAGFSQRPFVFTDIPGSFVQFLKLLGCRFRL